MKTPLTFDGWYGKTGGMDTDYPVGTVAFFAAMIFPFFMLMRWRGVGFFIAVMFGWGVIHGSNMIAPVESPVDGVFKGVWALFGWIYMLAWCFVAPSCVVFTRWFARKLRDGTAPDYS